MTFWTQKPSKCGDPSNSRGRFFGPMQYFIEKAKRETRSLCWSHSTMYWLGSESEPACLFRSQALKYSTRHVDFTNDCWLLIEISIWSVSYVSNSSILANRLEQDQTSTLVSLDSLDRRILKKVNTWLPAIIKEEKWNYCTVKRRILCTAIKTSNSHQISILYLSVFDANTANTRLKYKYKYKYPTFKIIRYKYKYKYQFLCICKYKYKYVFDHIPGVYVYMYLFFFLFFFHVLVNQV